MECNKDEAVRAKTIAETKMMNNDFEGGRKFALKARKLFPELENMPQMLAVCDVHCAAKRKVNNGAEDLYGILQVESLADVATIKKQYRKLVCVLHPEKNHFPGADSAFKLISEAKMILSDNTKRSLYDYSCRDSNVRPTFWTFCPLCKVRHKSYKYAVNKRIKCPNCSKYFIAIDIYAWKSTQAPHAGMQNVNPQTPTFSQQEEVGKQEKAKVDPQRAEPSFSHPAYKPPQCTKTGDAKDAGSCRDRTVENGDLKTKGGEKGAANKGTDSNGKKAECSKQSRKRSYESNSEEAIANFSPEKRYTLSKASSDVKDKQKEQKDVPDDADSEDHSESVYIEVPNLEFSNFDKDKEAHCFAVGQIWALYDTIDCMPRFYAQIRKVYSSGFRLRIAWLDADPEDLLERSWTEADLPVACGKFKLGDSEKIKDRLMFSHQITFEKGIESFSFVIYPKKGEIWALFKDWDITKWSSDPENHLKYKFEIVEILSDFDTDNGVLVAYMVKVEGFVSVFKKTSRAKVSEHRVPSRDLFRFSHRIPSLKLTSNERADVPVGSWELDTASLPDDLNQFYFSESPMRNVIKDEVVELDRPMGRKTATQKRKAEGKQAEEINQLRKMKYTFLEESLAQKKEFYRLKTEKMEYDRKVEDERLRLLAEKLRIKAEKTELAKKESDHRIMMMDVSSMPEIQRLYFEELQKEIIMKRNNA